MNKTIEIIAKRVKAHDGREFTSYRAVQKDGKLMDCRFTRDAGAVPDGVVSVEVQPGFFNVSYAKKYPCLWIKKVERFITKDEEVNSYDDLF